MKAEKRLTAIMPLLGLVSALECAKSNSQIYYTSEGLKMEKIIHDEKNGPDYELKGDYYIPCLKAPESPKVGRFGMRDYPKSHFYKPPMVFNNNPYIF